MLRLLAVDIVLSVSFSEENSMYHILDPSAVTLAACGEARAGGGGSCRCAHQLVTWKLSRWMGESGTYVYYGRGL